MSGALIRLEAAGDGATLSGLYFANSIGAAAGALIATFVLLPTVGLPGTVRFAGVLNLVVAAFAWWLGRDREAHPSAPARESSTGASPARLLLLAAAISRASSFVYEIGWVRMLAIVLGSTIHAFELMLAAFIGGLACGGLWIRCRIDRYADPTRPPATCNC